MRSACAPSGCEPGASPQGAVTRREILFTVIHCTGGEPLITASALAPPSPREPVIGHFSATAWR
jgi:hypothetical protein